MMDDFEELGVMYDFLVEQINIAFKGEVPQGVHDACENLDSKMFDVRAKVIAIKKLTGEMIKGEINNEQ